MCTVTDYAAHNHPRIQIDAVIVMCGIPSCPLAKEINLQAFRQGLFKEVPDMFTVDKSKLGDD